MTEILRRESRASRSRAEQIGTGWRFRSSEAAVKVMIGGVEVPVTYAGSQMTLVGVDQINVRLLRSLIGKGEVDVVVAVDGKTANTVKISVN